MYNFQFILWIHFKIISDDVEVLNAQSLPGCSKTVVSRYLFVCLFLIIYPVQLTAVFQISIWLISASVHGFLFKLLKNEEFSKNAKNAQETFLKESLKLYIPPGYLSVMLMMIGVQILIINDQFMSVFSQAIMWWTFKKLYSRLLRNIFFRSIFFSILDIWIQCINFN